MDQRYRIEMEARVSDLLSGVDIGGTKCATIIGTVGDQIIDRREWPSEANRGP